jgi:hypothetical protein
MTNKTGYGLDDWIYWHLFTITTANNKWLSKTRSIPYWTTSALSSTVTDLVRFTNRSLLLLLLPWTPIVLQMNPSRVDSMLRPTVSWPVYLGIKHQSGAYDKIFITVRQLQVCWCGVLPLTRRWVCRLQLLLVLASAVILGSESRGTSEQILLSQIWDFPFCCLLGLAGLRWRYSTSHHTGLNRSSLYGSLYSLTHTHGKCWFLVRIRGNLCWIFVYTKRALPNCCPAITYSMSISCSGNVCLASRWLAMDFRFDSTILAFRRHDTD